MLLKRLIKMVTNTLRAASDKVVTENNKVVFLIFLDLAMMLLYQGKGTWSSKGLGLEYRNFQIFVS